MRGVQVNLVSANHYLARLGLSPQRYLRMEVSDYINRQTVDSLMTTVLMAMAGEAEAAAIPVAAPLIPTSQSYVDYDVQSSNPLIVLDRAYYQQVLQWRGLSARDHNLVLYGLVAELLNRDFTRLAPQLAWMTRTHAWRTGESLDRQTVRDILILPVAYLYALTHPWTFFSAHSA
jgi:hypothetical protein